ncbi:MAG: Type II secretion system protein E [Syntrophorhabdaceae bacterium PtaU1.Bin034]|jgi:type IV pilus assembly protein PilB|nr:MAG: Type II secretion system protein E [Syntrophorhabdaceae bacterium PtaU1.Bin034]
MLKPAAHFGEFLVERGVITREQLSRLLTTQRLVRDKIGMIAVREGLLGEEDLTALLAEFHGIPLYKGGLEGIEKGMVNAIPMKLALKFNVLPVATGEHGELLLACSVPLPQSMLQTISRLCKRQVRLVMTSPRQLKKMQHLFFSSQFDTTIRMAGPVGNEDVGFIVELLEKLMVRAVNMGASDIHVEPEKSELIVRLRVDGMLHQTEQLPFELAAKLVSRIKVLAGMNIAERRKPQDGSFYFEPQALDVQMDGVNVRASVLPVVNGEKAVLRILPPYDEHIDLNALGMGEDDLASFKAHLRLAHGILLVTGPTGSGKSTTLYGGLQLLRSETINITTIEDPVELTLRGVNQTQVDVGERVTFAGSLRAILRQDPDVIMVGEIRDSETLTIALRAAITGHLVLATLHTNDAPSAFSRMMDMGGEPFLVSASVRAVLAQRLVRTVCSQCGEWSTMTEAEAAMLGLEETPFAVCRGAGCEHCHLGYRGRTGIFEFLPVDDELRRMIMARATFAEIKQRAIEGKHFRTLRQDGIAKVRAGVTTPEEIMRVTLE